MLYNKNKFRKANDKKVLRKIGKQWKVVSIALLLAIGGAGVASTTSVNASHVHHGARTERTAKSHHHHKKSKDQAITDDVNSQLDKMSPSQLNNLSLGNDSTESSLQTTVANDTGADLPDANQSVFNSDTVINPALPSWNQFQNESTNQQNSQLDDATRDLTAPTNSNFSDMANQEGLSSVDYTNPSVANSLMNDGTSAESAMQSNNSSNDDQSMGSVSPQVSEEVKSLEAGPADATGTQSTYQASVSNAQKSTAQSQYDQSISDQVASGMSASASASNSAREQSLTNASISASEAVSASNSIASESASNSARNASVASASASTSAKNAQASQASASASASASNSAKASQSTAQSVSAKNASLSASASTSTKNAQASQASASASASASTASANASASASNSVKSAQASQASASASVNASNSAKASQSTAQSVSAKNASLSASASASTSTSNSVRNASIASALALAQSTSTKHSDEQANLNTYDGQQVGADGLTQSVRDEVNSLEAVPTANQPVTKASSAKSSAKQSDNSQASVSYQNGDNGSAASYYNDTKQDQADYTDANAEVQSLTAQAPASGIKGRLASASARAVVDQSLATSYANTANQSNYSQKVSDIAKNANVTTSFYNMSVGYNFDQNSKAVSNGIDLTNQLSTINSYAQEINTINANSSASNAQTIKSASASANATVLKAKLTSAKNALNSLKAENDNIGLNNSAYNSASVADQIALINSQADSNFVTSLASSLNNAPSTHAIIQSEANNFNANATQNVNFKNASDVDVAVNANPGTSLNRVLSDTNAMNVFGNYKAENTLSTTDAENAVSRANIDYASASSEAKVAKALADHPTLANVIANVDGNYAQGMALANGKDANAVNSLANSASNSLANAKNNSASYVTETQAGTVLAPSLATTYSNKATSDSAETASANTDLNNFYSDYLGMGYTNANTKASQAKHALAHDKSFANAYGQHVYNFSPKVITVKKPLMIHTTSQFTKKNRTVVVKPGTELQATGIGFAKDGTTRFAISNYNGHSGFVTANPNYVNHTYLFADKGNKVSVKAILPIHEHKSQRFAKANRVRTFKPGTVVTGHVVSEDGVYGGCARIQLADGNFVTANTTYVKLNAKKTANVHKRASNGLPNQLVNFAD